MARTSINSTIKGKAYEYACVISFEKVVSAIRPIKIENNESLNIAKQRFENEISKNERTDMLNSAKAGIIAIIKMEPKIVEDGNDELTISLQPDTIATKLGDIRDILIIRRSIAWEIGVSVKHNHAALKHSRLSTKLDFGSKWFGVKCSSNYFEKIKPVFEKLTQLRKKGVAWSSIDNKNATIYLPILEAFKSEFMLINDNNEGVTKILVRYLLGSNGKDYYKLIHNKNHTTTIMPFNLFGTLNSGTNQSQPEICYPVIDLPTRIIEIEFKEYSYTTLILTMNNGWSISFRIHNASTIVEPSLKFDIQLQSKPENIYYLNVEW